MYCLPSLISESLCTLLYSSQSLVLFFLYSVNLVKYSHDITFMTSCPFSSKDKADSEAFSDLIADFIKRNWWFNLPQVSFSRPILMPGIVSHSNNTFTAVRSIESKKLVSNF